MQKNSLYDFNLLDGDFVGYLCLCMGYTFLDIANSKVNSNVKLYNQTIFKSNVFPFPVSSKARCISLLLSSSSLDIHTSYTIYFSFQKFFIVDTVYQFLPDFLYHFSFNLFFYKVISQVTLNFVYFNLSVSMVSSSFGYFYIGLFLSLVMFISDNVFL